ncbi:Uma2 family endonuclease [Anatilimnocola sp. NA78]|uniref:Uma2 family endonuclease n=1 Tax=Anatilimnocola sp. NA78 TaxID=3415683 RepID=UPI003CE4BEF4
MSTASSFTEKLFTAEEYCALPNDDRATELILGKIVEMNQSESRHGFYCVNIASALRAAIKGQNLGRVVSNDSGVVTKRNPDSVRGGDVLFYSYKRVAPGPLPRGYWPSPELVFEVRSPSDRWVPIIAKIQEYLEANVTVVVVVDPEEQRVHVYAHDNAPQIVEAQDNLDLGQLLPDVLPGCKLSVREFFEE